MIKIELNKLLKDKSYPQSGKDLYDVLVDAIKTDEIAYIDMDNVISLPSMFMNASFGSIIDTYGVLLLKKHLNFVNITKSQANKIKEYITQYEEIITKQNIIK